MPHSQGSPVIPMLNRIYPIPRIDTYFFKIHFNIALPSTPKSSKRSLSCRYTSYNFESTLIFFNSGYITCPYSRFNHPDYIRSTVQTMSSLIVEPSPLPILIILEPKYPQSSDIRDHVSQTYRTTGNIILYILIFKFLEFEKTEVFGLINKMNFLL